MADDRVEDARPALFLDGKANDNLRLGMLSLMTAESVDGISRCEITFGNTGSDGKGLEYLYFDKKIFDFGKPLRVEYKGALFEGRITGIEARFPSKSPAELVVLAEDTLQDLRMTRRTRTFVDQSDDEIFKAIAGEHSLDPKGVSITGDKHKLQAQVNQSDLAFLRERARAIEAELWISYDSGKPTLNAKARADRQSTSAVKLGYRNELKEFCVLADLATQRTSVTASGWDTAAKSAVKYEATDTDLGGELGQADSGAALLKKAFGPRKEMVSHAVPWTQAEVEARAKGHFKQEARKFVVGHGVAKTTGALRVGAMLDLDGLGPLFNGKYYLAGVSHRFDAHGGLRSEFSAERAGLGRP